MLAERYGFSRRSVGYRIVPRTVSAARGRDTAGDGARGADILILDEPTSILSECGSRGAVRAHRRLTAGSRRRVHIPSRAGNPRSSRSGDRPQERAERGDLPRRPLDECSLAELIIPAGLPAPRSGMRRAGAPVLEMRGAPSAGQAASTSSCGRARRSASSPCRAILWTPWKTWSLDYGPRARARLLLGKDLGCHERTNATDRADGLPAHGPRGARLVGRSSVRSNLWPAALRGSRRIRVEKEAERRRRRHGPPSRCAAPCRSRGIPVRREAEGGRGGPRTGKLPRLWSSANPAQGLDPASRALIFRRLAELRSWRGDTPAQPRSGRPGRDRGSIVRPLPGQAVRHRAGAIDRPAMSALLTGAGR